jgi:hypothetical protein
MVTLDSVQGLRRTAMLVVAVFKIEAVSLSVAERMEGVEGDIKRQLAMRVPTHGI